MTLTTTAVSSSIRIGGTAPPPDTVCGRSDTTAKDRPPATRSLSRSGVVTDPSRTVARKTPFRDSERHASDEHGALAVLAEHVPPCVLGGWELPSTPVQRRTRQSR